LKAQSPTELKAQESPKTQHCSINEEKKLSKNAYTQQHRSINEEGKKPFERTHIPIFILSTDILKAQTMKLKAQAGLR